MDNLGLIFLSEIVGTFLLLLLGGGVVANVALAKTKGFNGQVTWFKYTKKKYGAGRRLLKMAPLHHHFEKSGWKETHSGSAKPTWRYFYRVRRCSITKLKA